MRLHWPHQAQWVCAHLSGLPHLLLHGCGRHCPVCTTVPGGHSEAYLSCGEFTAPGDILFWKTTDSPRGCGNGGTAWGSHFPRRGAWGRPMRNAALRLGKGCRGTTSSRSRLIEGLHRLRDPGLTVPTALLPAGCLPPTDVQSRAVSWLHSVLHKASLRTRGP